MTISSAEELTVGLYERGAVGFATTDDPEMVGKPGGFIKLKSGRLSPTYVNVRGLTSFSEKSPMALEDQESLRDLAIDTYSEVIDKNHSNYDHLMGIPHAMTALAAMVGLRRQDSVLSMRTAEKAHGISKMIEGDYEPGEVVLPLDDVITDGASKFETLNKIKEAGLEVSQFVILVDREEGGREILEEAGLNISAALGMGGITAILAEQGRINAQQVQWTAEYFHKLVEAKIIRNIPEDLEDLV